MSTKKDNSRILPARFPQLSGKLVKSSSTRSALGVFLLIFMISFTATLLSLLYSTYSMYRQESAEKMLVIQQFNYWSGIVEQYPQFPAAYYEAAVYAARLENTEKARDYLQKALIIDPNFFEAEALAKELDNK